MGARSVITLTTAASGTGKSYRRCAHFLVTELLPQTKKRHISNFPIQFEPWGENGEKRGLLGVCQARGVCSDEEILDRVELIPDSEMQRWKNEETGPWEYFGDRDISATHIAIDEAHNFCSSKAGKEHIKKWQAWLGEVRHMGATIEFISQHAQKMHLDIRREAILQITLEGADMHKDPFFGIGMSDWYNLKAKLTGKYTPCVWEIEMHQRPTETKWVPKREKRFWFESDLFECYDSFSAPVDKGQKGQLEQEPWERMSWPKLLAWFGLRNLAPLGFRVGVIAAVVWLSIGGGGQFLMVHAQSFMESAVAVSSPNETSRTQELSTRTAADQQAGKAPEEILREKYPGYEIVDNKRRKPPANNTPRVSAEDLKPDMDEAAALAEDWVLGAVLPDAVTFRNGETYEVGETIDYGPYEGERIGRVDLRKRRLYLAGSDRPLRLGSRSNRVFDWSVEELKRRAKSAIPDLLPTGGNALGQPE